jgi:hypothetical protein
MLALKLLPAFGGLALSLFWLQVPSAHFPFLGRVDLLCKLGLARCDIGFPIAHTAVG